MRSAVCISGLPRSGIPSRDLRVNYNNLKQNFPNSDFYLSTWIGQEDVMKKHFNDFNVWYQPEPKINYHPFADMEMTFHTAKLEKTIKQSRDNKTFRETSSHQTKQIIGHARLLSKITEKYDVIIRTRFDTFTSPKANFNIFIEDSFKNKRAIGFACLKEDWPNFHSLREMDPKTEYVKHFLFDQLIIHHIDNINVANIFELSENKKLFAAEFGWWQVLSQNSGSNHRCFSGWANPDKSVLPHFLT